MKNYLILFVAAIIIFGDSCKKYPAVNPPVIPPVIPPVVPPLEKRAVVTTIAGEGSASFANGPALSAKFHFPEDVVIAPNGTMYVTDVLNFSIRKIAGGQVSTFAGGEGFGIINGVGAIAKFRNPYSITMDANGNLYTTDENDPRIRKTTPEGSVSTYAGAGMPGYADGTGSVVQFREGNSIVADAAGNVYVADALNNRIRKVSVSGETSTIAGTGDFGFNDGNAALAQFASPGGIAIDPQGNLYVVDRGNFRIRKITAAGNVSTFAGSGTKGNRDGNVNEAQFSDDLHDIVIDGQGNLYMEDENRIRKITPQGVVSTIAGSTPGYMDGDGAIAKFNFAAGLGIDAQGNLYVADLINNRIRKISFE